ncbi:MAG: VLRF1 family aeRF1-type release factor [Bacteroidota bacterium]|nr:VLRF1 family aeRF1-type release factor [Bacteroidota bacterium]
MEEKVKDEKQQTIKRGDLTMLKLRSLFDKMMSVDSDQVMSVYLETDPTVIGRNRAAAQIWLKDSLKSIRNDLPQSHLKDFEKIHSNILEEAEYRISDGKSLILFSGTGFFEAAHPQIKVTNEVWWGKPSIGQLDWILEEYRNYGIIKIASEKIHYYIIGLNEVIKEWEETISSDTLAWQSKHLPPENIMREKAIPGLRGGDTKEIVERHISEEVQKFWKHCTSSIEAMKKQFHVNEIVLTGLDSQTDLFQKCLNTNEVTVIGKIPLARESSIKEIISAAQQIFQNFERTKEQKLIDKIIERSATNTSASLGIKKVLKLIQEGRSNTVAITNGSDKILVECNDCGYVMTKDAKECLHCISKNLRVGSMKTLIPPLLRKYKTPLNIVSDKVSDIFNKQGIGALWRY